MGTESERISYFTLKKGTPVRTSDGKEIGDVSEIVSDESQDIFSGIAMSPGLFKEDRFIAAELVEEMTEDAVVLNIPYSSAEGLPPYES